MPTDVGERSEFCLQAKHGGAKRIFERQRRKPPQRRYFFGGKAPDPKELKDPRTLVLKDYFGSSSEDAQHRTGQHQITERGGFSEVRSTVGSVFCGFIGNDERPARRPIKPRNGKG